jgi:hypothetical protein
MRAAVSRQTARVSNEISPALGGGADQAPADRTARNGFHEAFLLREQLLERPRRPRQAAIIVAVVLIAVVLVTTGFVMFATLA